MKWSDLTLRGKIAIIGAGFGLFAIAGYFVNQHLHPAHPVTSISQKEAEALQGIDLAAHNAQIKMDQEQMQEVTKQIALLKNIPPDTVLRTVPVEAQKTVEAEKEKRGADFAVVTEPGQPDKKVDLKEVEKLPTSTTVNLNQYNVYAYKKVLRGINIYPDWSELAGERKVRINEISIDVSRRISNDGKYIGIVGAYEFNQQKAKVGIRGSF